MPFDQEGDAYVDQSGLCNARIVRDIVDVGKGLIDVAVLHWRHIDLGPAPARRFDRADQINQPLGRVITDNVKAVMCGEPARLDLAVVASRVIECQQNAGDDIVDR